MTRTHRFGRVIDLAGSEESGGYLVRDEESGSTYRFSDADIVTEGFRTARVGERVRFLIDPGQPGQAHYVIRLDLPEVGEYYE